MKKLIILSALMQLGISLSIAKGTCEQIPLLGCSPIIDGMVDSDEWKDAVVFTDFKEIETGKTSPETILRIARTVDSLLIAVECNEPAIDKMKKNILCADGKVWTDDGIELFIDTNNDGRSYCHLVINTAGVSFMEYLAKPEMPGMNAAWYPALKFKSNVQKNKWTAEFALPFASLRALTGNTIGINVCRNRFAGGKAEYYSLVQNGSGYHDPVHLKKIQFIAAKRSGMKYDCRRIDAQMYEGKLYVKGLKRMPKFCAAAEIWLADSGGRVYRELPVKIKPSGQPVIVDVADKAKFLYVIFKDAAGNILATTRRIIVFHARPVMLAINQPYYDIEKTIPVKLWLAEALDKYDFTQAKVTLFSAVDGKDILQRHIEPDCGQFDVSIENLKVGKYVVQVSMSAKCGKNFDGCVSFTKLKPPKHIQEVTVNASGATLIDGREFLPIGIYRMEPRQWGHYLKDTAFNTVHTIRVGMGKIKRDGQNPVKWNSLDEVQARLDNAHKLGLKVLLELGVYVKEIFEVEPGEENGRRLREVVSRFRRHPALLAYYIIDEPYQIHYARTRRANAIVKSIDPYHPTVTPSLGYEDSFKPTSELADILLVSCYPVPLKGNESQVAERMHLVRKLVGNKKPLWFVPQSFGRLHKTSEGQNKYVFPDRLQQRSMLYQGLLAGDAKGLILFAWFGDRPRQSGPIAAENPEYWKMLKALLDEVTSMKKVILAADFKKASIQCDNPLAVRVKKVDGKIWVLAVNSTHKPAELTISSSADTKKWMNIETGKPAAGKAKKIKSTFGPLEVQIWSCDGNVAGNALEVGFGLAEKKEK